MSVFIEGIGGTGKAVISLLHFAASMAKAIEENPPSLRCRVIDQDSSGAWPGVDLVPAATGAAGKFREALAPSDDTEREAAKLLYSSKELDTVITQGFHAHPKIVATLETNRPTLPSIDNSQVQVLVYSDVGGTGAGVGPVRLAQLIEAPHNEHVIAIVLGRYLATGNAATVGRKFLEQQRLPPESPHRYFHGFHLDSPPLRPAQPADQSSGLNPTPALYAVAAFIWRLLENDAAGNLGDYLGISGRGDNRESVEHLIISEAFLTSNSKPFSPEWNAPQNDLVRRLWLASRHNKLNDYLLNRTTIHYGRAVTVAVKNAGELGSKCLAVIGSHVPSGSPPDSRVDWPVLFGETFSAVADLWAAARWFHIAVRDGDPLCTKLFLAMATLFLHGKLYCLTLPFNGGQLHALVVGQVDKNNFESWFEQNVVGACSESFPFWTVKRFERNLLKAVETLPPIARTREEITIQLKQGGVASEIFRPQPGGKSFRTAGNTPPLAATFDIVTDLAPSMWSWGIYARVADWSAFVGQIRAWSVLEQDTEIQDGQIATANAAYACSVHGISLKRGAGWTDDNYCLTAEDAVDHKTIRRTGSYYYEIVTVDSEGSSKSCVMVKSQSLGIGENLAYQLHGNEASLSIVMGPVVVSIIDGASHRSVGNRRQ